MSAERPQLLDDCWLEVSSSPHGPLRRNAADFLGSRERLCKLFTTSLSWKGHPKGTGTRRWGASEFWRPEVWNQGVIEAMFPLNPVRRRCPCLDWLLARARARWHSLPCRHSTPISASVVCRHMAVLSLCVPLSPSYKDTSHIK